MKQSRQTQTQENCFCEQKIAQLDNQVQPSSEKQQSVNLIEFPNNKKKSNLQSLTQRNMHSRINEKSQRKRFFEIKSRKTNYHYSEQEIKKQCDMWQILMQDIAKDLEYMVSSDKTHTIKIYPEVKTDEQIFRVIASGDIGNSEDDVKEQEKRRIVIDEKKENSFEKLNETGLQINRGIEEERQSQQINNFSNETSNQHCLFYF